jgi:hypothetical protein
MNRAPTVLNFVPLVHLTYRYVANGGRVRPANVPNNAGISAVHGGQNVGHPFVANQFPPPVFVWE